MSKSKSKAARRKARATGVAKSGPVWHQTAEEATLAQMPRYNAHACGTGPHGDAKYNRARQKRDWQRELNREGARNRGFLPFITNQPSAVQQNHLSNNRPALRYGSCNLKLPSSLIARIPLP